MKRLNLCGLERARAQWRPCAIKCHSFGSTSARAGARSGKQTRKKAQPSNSSAARCYLTWHTVLSHLAHGLGLLHIPGHRGCSCCCLQGGSVPAEGPGPVVTEGRGIPRDIPGQGHPRAGTLQGRDIPGQAHPMAESSLRVSQGHPSGLPCPGTAWVRDRSVQGLPQQQVWCLCAKQGPHCPGATPLQCPQPQGQLWQQLWHCPGRERGPGMRKK